MVRAGVCLAICASVSAVAASCGDVARAQAPGAAATPSSVHLAVFDGSSAASGGNDSFVLSPSRPRARADADVAAASYAPASDPVLEAMHQGFAASGPQSGLVGVDQQRFADRSAPGPFVIVPEWMRTGRRPLPFAPVPLVSIGSCGQRSYRPSALLGPTAEARRRALFPLVQQAACEAGLPVSLMDAMLIQESGYNPRAVSAKGAFGLGQLMPGTARYLGVNRYDIRGNLNGAARYLREHLNEFGDARLALAAYNAGPGRVRRSRGVPNITETKDYVRSILKNWSVLENNESTTSWQKY